MWDLVSLSLLFCSGLLQVQVSTPPGSTHRLKTDTIRSFTKRLQSLNQGVVHSTDVFVWHKQPCAYLEAQNVSTVFGDWTDKGHCNYLYQKLANGSLVSPPSGMRSSVPLGGIATGHVELRADGSLHEWTIMNQSPATAAKIQVFDKAFFGIRTKVSSTKNKENKLHYLQKKEEYESYQGGKVYKFNQEIHDIEQNENAIDSDETVQSFLLRTHPPKGLPGVKALVYSGSHPVSTLAAIDDRLPINVSVVAWSTYTVADMNRSHTPAIGFSFLLENPSDKTVEASVMFNMPYAVEEMQQRLHIPLPNGHENSSETLRIKEELAKLSKTFIKGQNFKQYVDKEEQSETQANSHLLSGVSSNIECMDMCTKLEFCLSWTFFEKEKSCWIFTTANLNTFNTDASSGIRSTWTPSMSSLVKCMTLDRPGTGAPHGNISICGSGDQQISVGAGNDVNALWQEFATNGAFKAPSAPQAVANGAISATVTIAPGDTVVVPLILSWYFPNRDFLDRIYGNFYTHFFDSSENVADAFYNKQNENLQSIQEMHDSFTTQESSLPIWLSDILVNSLGHIRTAMWFKDGRWRQWEAVDCTNIDSVHNDGERHIPYIMFFPESTKNKMLAWAKSQHSNGMIPEQLRWGCPINGIPGWTNPEIDIPNGRVMSDVSSMFIVYLLELYRWKNETNLLLQLYPVAKKAAQWHMSVSTKYGLPVKIQNTYDILGLQVYDLSTYNSAFHLLAMRAAEEVALVAGDKAFANECHNAYLVGQHALDIYLWNNTANYYNSYVVNVTAQEMWLEKNQGAIMTDCFYAQVLAQSVGLGSLMANDTRLSLHLDAELRINDSPYGMLVQTGRYKYPGPQQDNAIWMMGNPNWATSKMRLSENVDLCLSVAKKSLDHWRSNITDQWNVAGIEGGLGYGADGLPWGTSHYGYYMSSWHIILALTGQQANLPLGSLTYNPLTKPPYKYPVMLPGVLGTLSAETISGNEKYTLNIEFGSLQLDKLQVSGNTAPQSPLNINAGESYSWE